MRGFSVGLYALVGALILLVAVGLPIGNGDASRASTTISQPPMSRAAQTHVPNGFTAFGLRYKGAGLAALALPIVGPVHREQREFDHVGPPSRLELKHALSATRHQAPQQVQTYFEFAQQSVAKIRGIHELQRYFTGRQTSSSTRSPTSRPKFQTFGTPQNFVTGPAVTGINHWWSYEEDTLAGIGKYFVNVSSGNVIVQSVDMSVPNVGIALAFRRTYNSESTRTYANSDGEGPSLYGDNWTNTADVHVAYNQNQTNGSCGIQQGISLFDIDGARYDYAPAGDCVTWIPPAGQFAQLYFDGSGYIDWLKPSGTRYVFEPLVQPNGYAGRAGMIDWIYGRNNNNYLTFNRSWQPDVSDPHNLWRLQVVAEDGRAATLQFANFQALGTPVFRLLQSLTWPDGTTAVTYAYQIYQNGSGGYFPDLTQVTEPSNGASSGPPVQGYSYWAPLPLLAFAQSPSYNANGNGPNYEFGYLNSSTVNVWYFGDVNPEPNDGTNAYMQPSAPHDFGVASFYRKVTITYPPGGGPGTTTWQDSDGHQSSYTWDTAGRVTQRADFTGDPNPGPSTLNSTQSWNTNNDLVSSVDPRGNESDFQFDTKGNLVAAADPAVTFNGNQVRPTRLYSYDAYGNIVAYCDSTETNTDGLSWGNATPSPSDSLCPQLVGSQGAPTNAVSTWSPTPAEPYGELSKFYSPTGYKRSFTYATGSLDNGLPTQIAGTCFSQSSGVQRCPSEQLSYDGHGNLVCDTKGSQAWALQYDVLGRVLAIDDPDDSLRSGCAPVPPGSTVQTRKAYYPNGQLQESQTPAELAGSAWTQFTYDADGNTITELHHFNCPIGQSCGNTTTKWYDGADRVIEVSEPHDSGTFPDGTARDYFTFPWMTRYLYDISSGGSNTFSNTPVTAHGNLFDTQEFLATTPSGGAWTDTKGDAYDALDRQVTALSILPCADQYVSNGITGPLLCASTVEQATTLYDAGQSTYGLVASSTDAAGQTKSLSYDNDGRAVGIGFAPASHTFVNNGKSNTIYSAARTYSLDLNARPLTVTSTFGTRTYTYDGDGNKQQETEPSGGGDSAAGTFAYTYYPDDTTASQTVTPAGNSAFSFNYAYRTDGLRNYDSFLYGSNNYIFSWSYSNAGRLLSIQAPVGLSSTTFSYDGYGRYASEVMAEGTINAFAFDQEGEVTSHFYAPTTSPTPVPTPAIWAYSPRGELDFEKRPTGGTVSTSEYHSANGVHLRSLNGDWDARNGLELGGPPFDGMGSIYDNSWTERRGYGPIGETFDDKNEITTYQEHGTCYFGTDSNSAPGYDAENHQWSTTTRSTTWPLPGRDPNQMCGGGNHNPSHGLTVNLYEWGELGHPVLVFPQSLNAYPLPETLHWAGDNFVYASTSQGVDDVKLDAFAEYIPGQGMRMVDRDFAGNTLDMMDPFGPSIKISQTSQNYSGLTVSTFFYEPRTDEITDGVNTFQGVRTYDQGSVSWTSPDVYKGVVGDPMSQKSYMWNRNNPIDYADPTGFVFMYQHGCLICWPFMPDSMRPKYPGPPPPSQTQLTIGKVLDYILMSSIGPEGETAAATKAMSPRFEAAVKAVLDWLGPEIKQVESKTSDLVLQGKVGNELRQVRFDLTNWHGDPLGPHINVETFEPNARGGYTYTSNSHIYPLGP